jgi:hypothetical protein
MPQAQPNIAGTRAFASMTRRIMDLYVILRRSAWSTDEDFAATGERSGHVLDEEMAGGCPPNSELCPRKDRRRGRNRLYNEAVGVDAIREHASRAGLPADEIMPIADTMLVRRDPLQAD